MVKPSSPSRLAISSATSRIAARVSSPLRMDLAVASVLVLATVLPYEKEASAQKIETNDRTIVH
jgi:hypothetical protein